MLSLFSNELARRSPWTCLSCSTLTRASQALITAPSNRSSVRIHQRKNSSSKTSSPPKDEPRAITTPAEAPSKETKPVAVKEGPAEKRPSTRISRRRSKDVLQEAASKKNDESQLNLPSVPSTQHLHPIDIHVASFFSIHRPISVTTAIPPSSNPSAFSSLFAPKPSKSKTADVIYTLSSAVSALENHPQYHQEVQEETTSMSAEEVEFRNALTQASPSNAESNGTHNLDMPAKTLHINLQELAKNFRPFVVPPPPVPLGALHEAAVKSRQARKREAQSAPPPKHKSYTTTLTIYESTHNNGDKTYETHTTPIIEDPSPSSSPSSAPIGDEEAENTVYLPPAPRNQPFLGRMRERQLQWEQRLEERFGGVEVWRALSVKRQRKLKMKKHKYKKLMKRTKNLRKRLGRA